MSGRGVHCAGSLLQRNVVSEDAGRIALDEGMPEDGAFQARAGQRGDDFGLRPVHRFRRGFDQIGRDAQAGIVK